MFSLSERLAVALSMPICIWTCCACWPRHVSTRGPILTKRGPGTKKSRHTWTSVSTSFELPNALSSTHSILPPQCVEAASDHGHGPRLQRCSETRVADTWEEEKSHGHAQAPAEAASTVMAVATTTAAVPCSGSCGGSESKACTRCSLCHFPSLRLQVRPT